MIFKLYVDGQLGLDFETLEDAQKTAKVFNDEGFDTTIIKEGEAE